MCRGGGREGVVVWGREGAERGVVGWRKQGSRQGRGVGVGGRSVRAKR